MSTNYQNDSTGSPGAQREALLAAYIAAGFALVPIPRGLKGPQEKGWNRRENAITTIEQAQARLAGDCNFGAALAYCAPVVGAVDLDALTRARPWLKDRGVDIDALLGAPEAVRIVSGRPDRDKLLYRLPRILPTHKIAEGGLELRCGTSDGLTVQDVLPPSLHPETGKPYRLIGDIAAIPPVPDALLALWEALGGTRPGGKLAQVQTSDPVLQTLTASGMVRADCGGGKFHIACPFAAEHSIDGGDGETAYFLAHTNGYAQAHFHCLHSHCEKRGDNEFQAAVLAGFKQKFKRPPPFAMSAAPVAPKPVGKDLQLTWLLEHAPAVLRSYMDWYMRNAIHPHPVFALVSGLLFTQAVVGRSHALPRGLRPNLWVLLLAPTESGKGDVPRLAQHALDALLAAKIFPAVPQFEATFASVEGLWWHLEAISQVALVDEELGKTLGAIIAAPEGTSRHAMRRGLLLLHDAAQRATVPPLRYSQRTRSAKVMMSLHYPWLSIVGTGVPRDIGSFAAAASDDGLLNRFLPIVVEDLPAIGTIGNIDPLPPEVVKWAGSLRPKGLQEAMAHPASITVLTEYEGMGKDWAAEADYGAQLAQDLPGVWGRLAEKVLKGAMLFAVLDGTGRITAAGFAWARRFVRWAAAGFARHFENEGGGAENEMDAMSKAFMATFNAPALAGTETVSSREFGRYGGRAWRGCRDSHKRRRVIETLIDDGLVEEVPLLPKGKGYRKLCDP